MPDTFESVLQARVDGMVDACTRCGKCVEACPVTDAAGLGTEARDNPVGVITGILDILRHGEGNGAAQNWASGCVFSGECVKACDYGVNPRFLVYMAKVEMARAKNDPATQRRDGVIGFRNVAHDVNHIARLQLDDALLQRLGQGGKKPPAGELPDFVFYTGCNVLKTPHIALLALDVMDAIGATYEVMGGPTHCCGVVQMRTGDVATSGRFGENTIDKLAQSKSKQVVSWCPSCQVQFSDTTLPTLEKIRGAKPFEMTPFTMYLRSHLDKLRPLLRGRVPMRIALHRHPGIRGVVEAAEDILNAVPGIEIVDLHQPAVGLQSNNLKALPAYRKVLDLAELKAAEVAGVDAIVAVYHSDHRALCAHERDWPFQILNMYEILGTSMGIQYKDDYKRLKMMQDADAIFADCADLVKQHNLDPAATKLAIKAMLAEQPAPLRGAAN